MTEAFIPLQALISYRHVRLDKKCGESYTKDTNQCHKGRGTAQVAVKPATPPADQPLEKLTIRQLQAKGREIGLVHTNKRTKDNLVSSIRELQNRSPKDEDSLRKTLLKREKRIYNGPLTREESLRTARTKSAISKAVGVLSPKGKRTIDNFFRVGKIEDKLIASLVGGAAVFRLSGELSTNLERNYRQGVKADAIVANQMIKEEEALVPKKLPLQRADSSVTFVVGGKGSPAADIAATLNENKVFGTVTQTIQGKKRKVANTNYVLYDDKVANEQKEFVDTENIGGAYDMGLNGYWRNLSKDLKGFLPPDFIGNTKLQDKEAARLAAQLYIYGQKQTGKEKKNVPINIMAQGTGGITARRAMDILRSMPRSGNRRSGVAIAEDMQFITLGTPNLGVVGDDLTETNFLSKSDRMASFPSQTSKIIEGVENHDVRSYMDNKSVRDTVRNLFNQGRDLSAAPAKTKRRRRR